MKRAARRLFTLLRVSVAIGLLVWLSRSGAIDWVALGRLVSAWPFALAALAILAVQVVVVSWRLCVLMKPRGLRLPLWASVRLTLIGLFFTACLPGGAGGDVVRIYYATGGHKGRGAELATILVLDRIAGMLALVCWPLAAAVFFTNLVTTTPVIMALLSGAAALAFGMACVLALAMARRIRRHSVLQRLARLLPNGSIGRRMLDTVHAYRNQPGTLAAAVGISFFAHALVIGATMLLAVGMTPDAFSWRMSLVLPLGFLANTLPLTPGGVGVGEAAMDHLFSLVGLTGGAESLLGWRILTLAISLLGLVFYAQGRRQFIHHADAAAADPGTNVLLAGAQTSPEV